MICYLNIKENNKVKTIDEFRSIPEAYKKLHEYRLKSDFFYHAYLSKRATKEWKNNRED